jgi:hypothetical protein
MESVNQTKEAGERLGGGITSGRVYGKFNEYRTTG